MKNKLILLLTGLILLISIGNILAIGITPGRSTIHFEPGLNKEVQFSIINSENKDMSVVFMVKGDLAEYVTLEQSYAEFSAGEESKSFTYTLNLPQKLSTPGEHRTEISALEMPRDIKEKGTFVGATVSVVTQLIVDVPYPNKYAVAEISVMEDGKEGIIFLVPVTNKGKLDIVNAQAKIKIKTALNEEVANIETDSKSLTSMERTELVANWDVSGINPGKYLAEVIIVYDDETLNLEKEFSIGEMALEIEEVNIKNFNLGGIAKFDAIIRNNWNTDIKDVFLNILVYNQESEVMADFKSPNYDIKAGSSEKMIAYWDTVGVHKGTYDSNLILKFGGDKSQERKVQMKITDDNIEVIGLTGRVIVNEGGDFNLNNILIIVVIFLVIVNIVWFVVVKRLLKRRGK